MKKVLALMLLLSTMFVVGCSSDPAPADAGKALGGAKNPETGGGGEGGAPITPQ